MTFLKRRTKLVSFRLSEEEYEQLNRACIAAGARSISDFARTALQHTVSIEGGFHLTDNRYGNGTQELIETMKDLSRRVGQLVGLAQANKDTGI
jgi:hypothetical protein